MGKWYSDKQSVYKCNECGREFSKRCSLGGHIVSAHLKLGVNTKKRRITVIKKCICGKEFAVIRTLDKEGNQTILKHEKICCSSKCSHSRKHNFILNKKISDSLLNYYQDYQNCRSGGKYSKYACYTECISCGAKIKKTRKTKLCSPCYFKSDIFLARCHEAGILSANKRVKRSKNEIYFFDLCKLEFPDALNNKAMFNGWDADVIIPEKKIAVLWNGPWHYRQVVKGHSLKQVQNRDKIKLKEIKKAGFVPYVIKDLGQRNKQFVLKEFNKFKNYSRIQ